MNQARIPGLVRRISYSSNESSAMLGVDQETAARQRTCARLASSEASLWVSNWVASRMALRDGRDILSQSDEHCRSDAAIED
jgi:hypothetical protein